MMDGRRSTMNQEFTFRAQDCYPSEARLKVILELSDRLRDLTSSSVKKKCTHAKAFCRISYQVSTNGKVDTKSHNLLEATCISW